MKLLLDTHIWLWRLLEPDRVSNEAVEALSQYTNQPYLSPISVWETLVLARKGRLEIDGDPVSWVRNALQASSLTMVPLTHDIAVQSENLPAFEGPDPADRFLIASAIVGEMALVTADRQILGYPAVSTIRG